MKKLGLLALLVVGAVSVFGYAQNNIIAPDRNKPVEYHCTRLVIHGPNGETVTLGSNASGTFMALNANKGEPGANFAVYVTGDGVPKVQIVDEYSRLVTMPLSNLITALSNQKLVTPIDVRQGRTGAGSVGAIVP